MPINDALGGELEGQLITGVDAGSLSDVNEPLDDISLLEDWPRRGFDEVTSLMSGDRYIVVDEEEELTPFMAMDVDALLEERDSLNSVEEGIAAGYPGFLCRLQTGCLKLVDWLLHVQLGMLRGFTPSDVSLGIDFTFSGVAIKGLVLWRIFHLHASSQESARVKKLWEKLIGTPIVDCLVLSGILANADWFINGPPSMPAFGLLSCNGS